MNPLQWLGGAEVKLSNVEQADLKVLCGTVAQQLAQAGYQTPALCGQARSLPPNIRERVAWLKEYSEILADQASAGLAVNHHKDLLWKFLAKMRFTPTSDIFDRITDDDFIEIYDMEGDQIYRSLNFFDLTSISVEEMITLNWRRDFKRTRRMTLKLLELVLRFATGRFRSTFDCAKVPVHRVEELIGKRHAVNFQFKYISPLKKDGKCVAMIGVAKAWRV